MKKENCRYAFRIVGIFVLMLLSTASLFAQKNKKDGLKTAIVNYNYSIDGKSMEMVLYYGDYGNIQCFKYDVEGLPYATIVSHDSIVEINYGIQAYRKYAKSPLDINFNYLTPAVIKKFEIKSPGTVDFMDKACTIFNAKFKHEEIQEMLVWLFRGVELRRQIIYKDNSKTDLIATYIEENPEISEHTFNVPNGFQRYK